MVERSAIMDTETMLSARYWNVARETLYVAVGFPLGLAWFTTFAVLLGLAIGTIPILTGFLVLWFALRLAGWCAIIERTILRDWMGVDIEPARRKTRNVSGTEAPRLPAWFTATLTDGSYWRELLFLGLRFFLGIGGFVLALLLVTVPVAGVVGFFLLPSGNSSPLNVAIGALAAIATVLIGPAIIRAYAQLHFAIARLLLGPSTLAMANTALAARATVAESKRDQSVSAAEAERQRIERDLHDGAQARLATVALDLGRAKRKLEQGADPADVAETIDAAHADAKAAIVELRNLARGIHPAVLTDRGLDAALSEVAARSEVPVALTVDLPVRPSGPTESAAYFAVSELISNINKHSGASNAWVMVRGNGEDLLIEVSDDGVGGVDTTLGTGVDGLHHRIESVDGTLTVHSPLGEGTTATIEIPLATGLDQS